MARIGSGYYFERFGFCERQILTPALPDLGLVVVIPCFNEPDLIGSLESLRICDRPKAAVEVIVVINSAADCSAQIRSQNEQTLQAASQWSQRDGEARFAFHYLHVPDLPPKQAGVGLARKIGMDEALRRFEEVGHPKGIIVCFDADCRCEGNYLTSIEQHFQQNPRTPGCSIYFEHPLTGSLGADVDEAIALYELHLRYYVQALRYAGFPYAHHTIGSSMAVRADIYQRQGGMNKRQAGEDFYFLQKVIPLGHYTDLTETAVFPSPRSSNRVPFGTGKAVGDFLDGQPRMTYPLEAFLDLKNFFDRLPELLKTAEDSPHLPTLVLRQSIRAFLEQEHFEKAWTQIAQNTCTALARRKRFFHWFNGFQAMKFIHHARDHYYGERAVVEEAKKLLPFKGTNRPEQLSLKELLRIYRALDRIPLPNQPPADVSGTHAPNPPASPRPNPTEASAR